MRDLIIVGLVVLGCLAALRAPWIGILVWTWLSLMNPHRFAYGFSYDAPLAALAAAVTLMGVLVTRQKTSPFKGPPVVAFILFCTVMTLSWLLGLNPEGDYYQWSKVMKVNLMIIVALALINTKQHMIVLMWVVVGSLAILGAKGGVFTLLSGGNYRVWGPPGSFIEDNNEFALALVMTVPLLRFLHLQTTNVWMKRLLLVCMVLCAVSALGSHSRGALLAIIAMATFLWLKGKNKLQSGLLMLVAGVLLIAFMPAEWSARMHTIDDYKTDESAMGRINAWWCAWNIAWHYLLGVGFNPARSDLFALYAPVGNDVHAAHSIYFQVLGNHGFPGLFTFLAIWLTTWRCAAWLLREGRKRPESAWCSDLGAMAQVSLIAYAVGGAFLSLAYFDLPYNLMLIVVCARVWVMKNGWTTELPSKSRWAQVLGLEERKVPEAKR